MGIDTDNRIDGDQPPLRVSHNNRLQRPALRAAAEPER
jgi:hypothetical protein